MQYGEQLLVYTIMLNSLLRNVAYLSLVDSNPVRWKKPFVTFYVIYAIPKVSETLCEVNLQQIAQKVF